MSAFAQGVQYILSAFDSQGWNASVLLLWGFRHFGGTSFSAQCSWISREWVSHDLLAHRDHNEIVTVQFFDGNSISSDYDIAKAVIWWYDRRHEIGTTPDDIDLTLEYNGGSLLGSTSSFDNKERVFADTNVGGDSVSLDIKGYSVTSDGEGCGINSMRVYYAAMLEDSDRDESNGKPDWNASTCEGVPPE